MEMERVGSRMGTHRARTARARTGSNICSIFAVAASDICFYMVLAAPGLSHGCTGSFSAPCSCPSLRGPSAPTKARNHQGQLTS